MRTDVKADDVEAQVRAWRVALAALGQSQSVTDRAARGRVQGALLACAATVRALTKRRA